MHNICCSFHYVRCSLHCAWWIHRILGGQFVMLGTYTLCSVPVSLYIYWWKFLHIGCFLQDIWLDVVPLAPHMRSILSYLHYVRCFSALSSVGPYFSHLAFSHAHSMLTSNLFALFRMQNGGMSFYHYSFAFIDSNVGFLFFFFFF